MDRAREFRAPATESETLVCATFAQVLGVRRIGLDDKFFELGGTSLRATTLAARLSTALGQRVSVLVLFTGCHIAHGPSPRRLCFDYVESHWTDMRPNSLIEAMRRHAE